MRPSLSEMCVFALLLFAVMIPARAQDNYEIQEYSYDTVAPGDTIDPACSQQCFPGTHLDSRDTKSQHLQNRAKAARLGKPIVLKRIAQNDRGGSGVARHSRN
jgi:hypothetical protein